MKLKLFLLLLALPFFGNAQNTQKNDSGVKIYSYKNRAKFGENLYENKIWWIFYKFDWNEKTIQRVKFEFEEGDKTPNLTDFTTLFKNSDTNKFIIINPNKIKVKRIKNTTTRRAWNNFATPRTKSNATPAEIYLFKNETFSGKNKGLIFVLDKELTVRYEQEKLKQQNEK